MSYSTTYSSIIAMFLGVFFVNTVGLTESCGSEVSLLAVNALGMAPGALAALIARYKKGDVKWFGARKK